MVPIAAMVPAAESYPCAAQQYANDHQCGDRAAKTGPLSLGAALKQIKPIDHTLKFPCGATVPLILRSVQQGRPILGGILMGIVVGGHGQDLSPGSEFSTIFGLSTLDTFLALVYCGPWTLNSYHLHHRHSCEFLLYAISRFTPGIENILASRLSIFEPGNFATDRLRQTGQIDNNNFSPPELKMSFGLQSSQDHRHCLARTSDHARQVLV
jgi:hypothetical protein